MSECLRGKKLKKKKHLEEYELQLREKDVADSLDDARNQSRFSAPCSRTRGITKGDSIL